MNRHWRRRKLPPFVSPYVRIPALGVLGLAGIDRDAGKRVSPGRAVLLVYRELSICSRNGNRLVNYGRKSMAEKLGIGEATAWRALKALQDAGIIQKAYQSLGGRFANGWRVVKDIASSTVRSMPSSFARKKCIDDDTPTNPSTKGTNNRPPNAFPKEGKAAEYRPPPPLFEPQDTSENANWDAIGKNLQLLSETKWSIP